MIVVTSDTVPGRRIESAIGLVKGNSVRARNVGRDITAFFKNVVGGELDEYTKLLAESREQALDRMCAQAEELGANAVCGMRFSSSEIVQGAAELLAYGTAVKLAEE